MAQAAFLLGMALLLAAEPSCSLAQSQDDPAFTLRVKARTVITDVVVLDTKNRPVAGLPASAFQLTDDGVPQPLASFTEHTAQTERAGTPEALPADTFSSDTSAFPSVVNVLVIDTLSLSFVDQMFLAYQLERLIAALPPTASLAVYLRAGTNSVQLQAVTSDHTLLLNAVHRALPHLPRFTVDRNQEVDTLHQISADLGRVPGRKNVLWLTGSVAPPFTLDSLESGKLESGLRIAYDELQAARIAMYPIDARGLLAYNVPSMGYSRRLMDDIAEATGGVATYNNNGIAIEAARILANGTSFYTLSYTPKGMQFDGRWHKVRVSVSGNYRLSYRHGFYADEAEKLLPGGPRIRLGMLGNTYKEDPEDRIRPVVFTAKVAPSTTASAQAAPARGKTRYIVDFAVSPDGFKRRLDAGKSSIHVRVAILAMDRYGMLLNSKAAQHDFDVNEDALRQHPDARIPVPETIDLPSGDSFLYLVVWDPLNERAGTLSVPITVAKVK